MTGLLAIVRRVRRPLVVGTGSKGSPPPVAVNAEGRMQNVEVQAGCVGEECQRAASRNDQGPRTEDQVQSSKFQDPRNGGEGQVTVERAATGRRKAKA